METGAGQEAHADGVGLAVEIESIVDRTVYPMAIMDPSGRIRHANPAAAWLIGRDPSSARGVNALSLVHPDDRRRARHGLQAVASGQPHGHPVECRVRGRNGAWRTIVTVASDLGDLSSAGGILVSATDVTAERDQERSLQDLALRNSVTGLPNRVALRQRLESEMSAGGPLAVAFLDLDHFKRINDCLGHTLGDTALQAVGARLASLIPERSMVAHFGADTFVVVLCGIAPERSVGLAWECIARLANPLFVGGHELRLAASVGVAVRDDASTAESIVRDADVALSRAKLHRRGGVEVFTETLRTQAIERLTLETDLRHAAERGQLALHLQPVVKLATGRSDCAEALLRWTRTNGESVSPSTFIAVAEETGAILSIGEWVLTQALDVLVSGEQRRIHVNLSPRQLLDPALPDRVERLLAARKLAARAIAFEVTEAVVIENFDLATESLNRLRQLGCAVGMDDFGVGYSSLGYLRRLPVDFLKLDRTLVEDIDIDPQAAQIAATIVSLATTLSLTTIGEGIERQSQADALAAIGCQYGQGWLFGRPAPAGALGSGRLS